MATVASVTADVTTCPICLEMFDNPKSLPCLHTFCLKCLQGYFKDKCLGDEVPCPMCRKEFEIPDDGLEGLQHHFFVQRLVDVRKVESSAEIDEVLCEVCVRIVAEVQTRFQQRRHTVSTVIRSCVINVANLTGDGKAELTR